MKLSIVICTRNNCASLLETLEPFQALHVPVAAELVIVDNGSTDGTWEALRAYTHPTLPVRRIMEEERGQCNARNRALAETKGDVIAFTDDDVRVPPDWISSLLRPILDGRADGVVGGVRLAPHLQRSWMTPLNRAMLGSTERLDPAAPDFLIGANMAFLRSVTAKVPAFDPELDPGRLGGWGDSLFSWQLKEAGFRLRGAFDHEIEHHFAESRLSRSSLLKAARIQGSCRAYVLHHWHHELRPARSRHLTRAFLSLMKRRVLGLAEAPAEGLSTEEFQVIERLFLELRWLRERRRPRNYSRRGLVRKVPIRDAAGRG